jgi:hypothetical protein
MKNADNTKKPSLDFIVVSVILLASLLIILFTLVLRRPGAFVTVEINGVVSGKYKLSESGTYVLNEGTNTLVIEGGKAYLINSHCPDKTCEKTGKVYYVGQSIVCLPNKLSVTVRGEQNGGVDLVS